MTAPQFVVARLSDHQQELLHLNVEYVSWVFAQIDAHFGVCCAEIVGGDAPAYVASVLDKVCNRTPPEGIFYLVHHEGKLAGMGGLRGLDTERAEIKRLFVLPEFRGARLGERVLARLLGDARAFGYRWACLETGPFMGAAHRLYEAAGFRERAPYPEAEVPKIFHPRWRFLERPLI